MSDVQINLPDEVIAEATALAAKRCTSLDGLIGSALREVIDRQGAADHAAMVGAGTDIDAMRERAARRKAGLADWKAGR